MSATTSDIALTANDRAREQLVRYEALFSLLNEIETEEDLAQMATCAARQWKYFATAANWRLLLPGNNAHLLIEASRGSASLRRCPTLPAWEAALLAAPRPLLLPAAEARELSTPPPASLMSEDTTQFLVLPFVRDERCRALLSVAALHGKLTELDKRFIRLFGAYFSDRIITLLIRHENTAALIDRATRDVLTGVFNRGAILDKLELMLSQRTGTGQAVGLILGDIDRFKDINDSHGHQVGDEVLREVTRRLRTKLRSNEWVGRYGGEEFLVVLGNCDGELLQTIAERLRHSIASSPVKVGNLSIPVSISFGTASAEAQSDESMESVLQRADSALYAAKAQGRNCVVGSKTTARPQHGTPPTLPSAEQ